MGGFGEKEEMRGTFVADQPNATMTRFGYPGTLVAEYDHWAVLVRPAQVTLGSLVLACSEEAQAFSAVSEKAFAEMPGVIRAIEHSLTALWRYNKINYLMLMMADPHVHFHVIPRYEEDQVFNGMTFSDTGWPKLPDLGSAVDLDDSEAARLAQHLRQHWHSA